MPTKSSESDVISTSLLKEILLALAPSLAKSINISLVHGIFTSYWKVAIIRPLLKKSRTGPDHWQLQAHQHFSVSLQSCGKVMLEQFTMYCDTHKLIPDYQSAYRKYFSCETSIIKVVNDILWNFENKKYVQYA